MPLGEAIEGARHTAQRITWQDEDGDAWTLTSSTVTGTMRPERGGTARAITGTLVLVDSGDKGQFDWTYSVADIETPGVFWVQFKAAFNSTYDLSKKAKFEVLADIS